MDRRQTNAIVTGIEPELGARERNLVRRKPTESLTAQALFQHGKMEYLGATKEGYARCSDYLSQAIVVGPGFALLHSLLARLYYYRLLRNWSPDEKKRKGVLTRATHIGRLKLMTANNVFAPALGF